MSDPYINCWYEGRYWKLHQLVWMKANGPIPKGFVVDHIDGDTSNNELENLRLASKSQNGFNSKTPKSNKTGVKGLCWVKGKNHWMCQIRSHPAKLTFRTKDLVEAVSWLYRTREELHGEFARHH